MRAILIAVAALDLIPLPASAQKLGEHPAIVVQRLYAKQRYDYESKFYPHPAWLYLASEPPRKMVDHPAVIIAKRRAREACVSEVAEVPAPWTGSPFVRAAR